MITTAVAAGGRTTTDGDPHALYELGSITKAFTGV